ncbi:Uu.00g065090.m01.CDS01 [Anthostomella pinea]|uniref:Uu.00g065090.m01.CDS01 n=1 Tax=Anthostomella pinea TaxID=933095 RepID=A0AAI8VTR2_9PEZI|nr:Uu.00g065090.m01.CDS01 [Anthostomella pinea]
MCREEHVRHYQQQGKSMDLNAVVPFGKAGAWLQHAGTAVDTSSSAAWRKPTRSPLWGTAVLKRVAHESRVTTDDDDDVGHKGSSPTGLRRCGTGPIIGDANSNCARFLPGCRNVMTPTIGLQVDMDKQGGRKPRNDDCGSDISPAGG